MYAFNRTSGHHMLNFIAIDLQLYKIFKITRVSFFGTWCILLSWWRFSYITGESESNNVMIVNTAFSTQHYDKTTT